MVLRVSLLRGVCHRSMGGRGAERKHCLRKGKLLHPGSLHRNLRCHGFDPDTDVFSGPCPDGLQNGPIKSSQEVVVLLAVLGVTVFLNPFGSSEGQCTEDLENIKEYSPNLCHVQLTSRNTRGYDDKGSSVARWSRFRGWGTGTESSEKAPGVTLMWSQRVSSQNGDCVVTVLLAEEDKVEDDVVFYLVFSGSTLHHCTSTRKVGSDTLETIAPGHDCCETVKVLLCASKEGLPVFVVAEEYFEFIQDEAYDAAQFLATSAGNQQALNFTRFLDQSGPPSGDVNSLDEKVALAFRHLKLPAEWNVLGTDETPHGGGPRETLMHFAVRLGLLRLTWFLLQKPGGRRALSIHNQEGATPASLALERGYHELHQLLTEENAGEPESWRSLSYEIPYGDCSVRHHRELDVYTLTSESESHHEPPFPGDTCTGHIFKLMNIQQQLTKTNPKQMDNLMPLMVTAQDPSGLPSARDVGGQSPPCASEPADSQQLSSPGDAENLPCCQGSTAGPSESSWDLSRVVKEENTDCSCGKKNKGTERKGEAAGPTSAGASGPGSAPDSCLQSMPDYGGKGTEGLPSCGIGNEETGTKSSVMATEQESPSSGDGVLQGDMIMEPGTTQRLPGAELVASSTADASVPVTAGETGHGLWSPDATIQRNVLEVEESTKETFEDSSISTAGASDVTVTSKPTDNASIPNGVSATSSLDGNKPAESLLVFSNGETSTEKTAEMETSRSCEESGDGPGDENCVAIPAAAKDRSSDGAKLGTPSANTCEAMSPSGLTLPRPQKDVMPNQKSETNLSHVQSQKSQLPICSTARDGDLHAAPVCRQGTGTSGGVVAAEHCDDTVIRLESTTAERPRTQHLPTAICAEGPQASTASPDPVGAAQEHRDFCPLDVPDKDKEGQGQGKDLKLETPVTDPLEVAPYSRAVVPKAEKELVPYQAVTSDRTFSLASSTASESVTKDDALSLVPSQKEKGTATSELHTAVDCTGGPDGDLSGPGEQPLEGSAAGQATASTALHLQRSMGNTSPKGLAGQHKGPHLSAAPEVLNIEGDTDSFLLHVGKATLASDSILTEKGKNLVVPENSAAQGQDDKDTGVTCSSVKEDTLSSGKLQEEPRTPSPGRGTSGFCEEAGSAACAVDRALQEGSTAGTPAAQRSADAQHSREVAPPVSLLTEGGAAQSLVLPGASLAADSNQEALGAEQSSSPVLPGLLPDGSEALRCNQSFAPDVGVKNTQSQGKNASCEVSRNVLDVAVVHALQGPVGAKRKDVSQNTQDTPIPQVSLSREKSTILDLSRALPYEGVTDPQGTATPEMIPFRGETGKLERAACSCSTGSSKGNQMDDEAHLGLLRPVAKELPTESGLSSSDDKVPSRERGASFLPSAISAEAVHLPKRTDSIEEAASRIVDAVIEHVRASGALVTEGDISHTSLAGLSESGPATDQLERVSAGQMKALCPGETPQMGSSHEEPPGKLVGHLAGREEPEKTILPVQGPEPPTEMPDRKDEEEVDFLSDTREGSASEEVAVGNTATTPAMKPGPKAQAVKGKW
ncbi:hypothetical protein MC885_019622 [Smutsia gigantea]|nr:hypothetical protein MC885_019622 [Smutsia gigantea]